MIFYLVERCLFGFLMAISFILFMIKFVGSINELTGMPRPLRFLTLLLNLLLGLICLDPHEQEIFSAYAIRILTRLTNFATLILCFTQFNIYFFNFCEKIYRVPPGPQQNPAPEGVSLADSRPARRNSKLGFIKKPENVEDSQMIFDLFVYTEWQFIVCFICFVLSFFYWHTFLHVAGMCFVFLINIIQLHFKWLPYRLAYVHRLSIDFEEYKTARLLKNFAFWINFIVAWLLFAVTVANASEFDHQSLSDCENLACDAFNIDFVVFLIDQSILFVLLRFLFSDPITKPSTPIHKEESKNNNSPRPASDITSNGGAENLSTADKTIIARFLSMPTTQTENIFIPLGDFSTEARPTEARPTEARQTKNPT